MNSFKKITPNPGLVENCSSKSLIVFLTSLKCNEISCCNKLSVENVNCVIFCICI